MIETIKHFLGLCGEPHPSLMFGGLFGSGVIYYYLHTIKWCFKSGCSMCVSKIKKLTKTYTDSSKQ